MSTAVPAVSLIKGDPDQTGKSTLPTFPTEPDPPDNSTFPAALASSKAAGVSSIRISRAGRDVRLERLDASGKPMNGFVMHPNIDSAKKVTSVAITRIGSTEVAPLNAADKAALSAIVGEVSGRFKPAGGGVAREKSDSNWFATIMTVLDCGGALLEAGANPIADAACVLSAGSIGDGDDGDGDEGSGSGSGSGITAA